MIGLKKKMHRARQKAATGWFLVLSLLMLFLTRWGLVFCGFKRWAALLDRWSRRTTPRPLSAAEIQERLGRSRGAVRLAVRIGVAPEARRKICLRQALVLRWLLGRQGIETDLHVGAGLAGEQFEAHAWLAYQGQTLIGGRRAAGLVPFARPLIPADEHT